VSGPFDPNEVAPNLTGGPLSDIHLPSQSGYAGGPPQWNYYYQASANSGPVSRSGAFTYCLALGIVIGLFLTLGVSPPLAFAGGLVPLVFWLLWVAFGGVRWCFAKLHMAYDMRRYTRSQRVPAEKAPRSNTDDSVDLPPDAGALPTPMPGPRDRLTILPELDRMHTTLLAAGYSSRIGSGFRTIDEQIQIYAKGRTFGVFKADITAAVAAGSVTQAKATEWISYYDPTSHDVGVGHPMPAGEPGPVTWTFKSRHLTGDAADIVDATLGWDASPAFWAALKTAAGAEGLQIGPPATDVAHVQRP
jgi:hypothetical protein